MVKLFTPAGAATWLLAWTCPEDLDLAYGLCDLGVGFPELGPVQLSELVDIRDTLGHPVERDRLWKPAKPLNACYAEARRRGFV